MYIKKYIWQTQTLGSRKYKGYGVKRISLHIFCVYLMRFFSLLLCIYRLEDIFLSFMAWVRASLVSEYFFWAVIKIFIAFIRYHHQHRRLRCRCVFESKNKLIFEWKIILHDIIWLFYVAKKSVHSRIICIGVTPSSYIEWKHLGTIQCGVRFGKW